MSEVEETKGNVSPVEEGDPVEAAGEKDEDREKDDQDESENDKDDSDQANENQEEPPEQNFKDLEKQEEAKFTAKYPEIKGRGASSFLQKRLSKGTKYFDSGDYNMAKATAGGTKPVIGAGQKVILPGTTGEAIPTPETVPHKKISLLQSKLINLS